MSNPNKIDQRLRDLAHGKEMDFQMDAVWNKIDGNKKRRRPWLLWIFGVTILGLAGGYAVISMNTSSHEPFAGGSTEQAEESKTVERISLNKEIEIHSTTNENAPSDLSTDLKPTKSGIHDNPTTTAQKKLQRENPTNSNPQQSESKVEAKPKTISSIQTPRRPYAATSSHPNLTKQEDGQWTSLPSKNTPESTAAPSSAAQVQPQSALKKTALAQSAANQSERTLADIPGLDPITISLLTLPLTHARAPETKSDWSKCKIRQHWAYGAEVYGGYVRGIQKYSGKSGFDDIDTDAYLSRWEDVETMHGGFKAGISGFLQAPNGVEMMVGVDYADIEEELALSETITTTTRVYDPMAFFIIDPDGNRIYQGDTVTQVTTTTRTLRSGKHRRLINIPIRVGYMMREGDWAFGGHIGGALQISNSYEGPVMRFDNTIMELDDDNMDLFFDDGVRFSGLIDLHIGRFVNEDWEVFFRPEFRYHPSSWDSSSSPLELGMHLASAQIGLRRYW